MILLSNFMEFLCSNIFLTGYISGNNTFPKPLDEKEEEKYLQLFIGLRKKKRKTIEIKKRLPPNLTKNLEKHKNICHLQPNACNTLVNK